MSAKEAKARIKINRLLEAAGWRFFDDENGPANIQVEANVKITKKQFDDCGITTLQQEKWKWAKDRITAGFVLELPKEYDSRYALFFHGDNEEKHLFGASLAVLFFDSVDSLFSVSF